MSKKRSAIEFDEEENDSSDEQEELQRAKKKAKSGKEPIPTGKSVSGAAPVSHPTVNWEIDEELTTYNINGRDVPIPKNRPVRVYADGIYDLFHMGHARSLLQAKSLFPNTCLVVGVCGDEITHKLKGKTVMNEKERVEAVSHCRYVDEVIPLAPWIITPEYMKEHRIDYVSHGEDLSVDENGNDVYQGIKDLGRFLVIKRTDGISTSDLILRIVKDYDKYVRRNLQRGYSYKEMNVGFMKRQEIKFDTQVEKYKHKYDEIKDDVIDTIRGRRDRLILDFQKWRDASEDMLVEFMRRFRRVPLSVKDRQGGAQLRRLAESPESPNSEQNKKYADLFSALHEEEEDEDIAQ